MYEFNYRITFIEGVNFKDISPLLSIKCICLLDMGRRVRLDYWVGIDSRGYLFTRF